MVVDFFGFESKLYPLIDAAGMRGENELNSKFEIGDGHKVEIKIINHKGIPLNTNQPFNADETKVSINFWSGLQPWFRVDNDVKLYMETSLETHVGNFLHLHLESGTQKFDEHIPIPGSFTLAEVVSFAFEKAKETVWWKFPESKIQDSSGIVGFF